MHGKVNTNEMQVMQMLMRSKLHITFRFFISFNEILFKSAYSCRWFHGTGASNWHSDVPHIHIHILVLTVCIANLHQCVELFTLKNYLNYLFSCRKADMVLHILKKHRKLAQFHKVFSNKVSRFCRITDNIKKFSNT